jgi:hypothetical protein
MPEIELIPHPSTPSAHVRGVKVSVDLLGPERLALRYEVRGDIDELELPPQTRSQSADGLWKTTCFEAFLRVQGTIGYVELNFSPSSEWAAYRFDGYRQGMSAIATERPPRIVCRRRDDTLTADIDVDLRSLGALRADLHLALSTVVKDRRGGISYWAIAHPPGKPDFHHADGFALRIAAAGDEQ